MASVIQDPNGRKRVSWTAEDGSRPAIRLGKTTKKQADAFARKIEAMLAAKTTGMPIDAETARWLADLPVSLHDKLAAQTLVEPRPETRTVTVESLLAAYFTTLDHKASSVTRMEQARKALTEFFGGSRDATTITEAEAESWRSEYRQRYSPSTTSRTVKYARQFWRWAKRRGMVSENPFEHLRAGSQTNANRRVFIDRATITKVIDVAPDAEWRLLIALSRYCGLRVPSEALALRWADVDWANHRLRVRSSKTEHHEGKGERLVPMFPEVREELLALFGDAPEGSETVIRRYRKGANLRTQFCRIIRRAGLTPWPKVWHNLRASRQTELADQFPAHVVCAWIGNSEAVAMDHYLQVTDAHWERAIESGAECGAQAAQNAAQHRDAPLRAKSHATTISGGEHRPCASQRDEAQPRATGSSGPGRTRTSDLTLIRGAL
jgi:integrase